MLSLEFLDLCCNNLSGTILKSLEALVYLKYMNFSFNKLSGEIPIGSPFANVNSQSFLYNDALCGDSKFNIKPCQIKFAKKSRRKTVIIGLYTLLGIGLLLALVSGCVVLRLRKAKKNTSQADVSPIKEHERISYYELEQASEGLNESNLLGTGSFSMVYKGILKDGTLLEVKVFNVRLESAFKSFDTECETFTRRRPSDEIFTGELSMQHWVSDSFPSGIHKVMDSNLIQPEDEQIDAKMQWLLYIMELALSCTLVAPDARISIKNALSTLKKIRLQPVNNLH